jgi:hypothetical protein
MVSEAAVAAVPHTATRDNLRRELNDTFSWTASNGLTLTEPVWLYVGGTRTSCPACRSRHIYFNRRQMQSFGIYQFVCYDCGKCWRPL